MFCCEDLLDLFLKYLLDKSDMDESEASQLVRSEQEHIEAVYAHCHFLKQNTTQPYIQVYVTEQLVR